jgi:hypothetical protein
LDTTIYSLIREKALQTAQEIGLPSFYVNHEKEMAASRDMLINNTVMHKCMSYLDESKLHPAHGIQHCEKVALEAGAIVQAEHASRNVQFPDIETLMLCSQIAGLFHDIKRNEDNHTVYGSIETERILLDFELEDRFKRYITAAIRNHEAFKEVLPSEDGAAQLISDSLYDADKFRWGPDNFTTTLWLIMESTGTPAEMLYTHFQEKMDGIKKIKYTFRTHTGKRYGPEFIDAGIEIGNMIYSEISRFMGNA